MLQLAAVRIPTLRQVLGTVTPTSDDGLAFVVAVVVPVAVVEIQKLITRRMR